MGGIRRIGRERRHFCLVCHENRTPFNELEAMLTECACFTCHGFGRTLCVIVVRPKSSGFRMSSTEWVALEQKVSELMELCAILSRENRALRAQQQNWTTERAKLIEKNELAKSRVESMITRLKALEQD
jgi:cell division protein ZapB